MFSFTCIWGFYFPDFHLGLGRLVFVGFCFLLLAFGVLLSGFSFRARAVGYCFLLLAFGVLLSVKFFCISILRSENCIPNFNLELRGHVAHVNRYIFRQGPGQTIDCYNADSM